MGENGIYDNRYLVQLGPKLPDGHGQYNHYFSNFNEMLTWLDRGYEVWEGGPGQYAGWVGKRRLTKLPIKR